MRVPTILGEMHKDRLDGLARREGCCAAVCELGMYYFVLYAWWGR